MPKLITTRTRFAYLGKPRIIIIKGIFEGLSLDKDLLQLEVKAWAFIGQMLSTFLLFIRAAPSVFGSIARPFSEIVRSALFAGHQPSCGYLFTERGSPLEERKLI